MHTAASFSIVFVTAGTLANAKAIARVLVKSKAAACVNIIPGLHSIYRWKGKISQDREWLLVIKTRKKNLEKLEKLVQTHHKYDVPEIISFPLQKGNKKYLDWLLDETSMKGRG